MTGPHTDTLGTRPAPGLRQDAQRILPLAWPVVVGQVALLGFGTVDTLLMARQSATDLAALAVGGAVYITVFVGLMGVILAISPIVGQLYGAQRLREAGHQVWQGIWLAGLLSLLGSTLLAFPMPFLALAQASPEVTGKVRDYLLMLALALPASLLFQVFRGFNTAVSRPKAVMVFQVAALGLKVPLSWCLGTGVAAWGLPAMGVLGCGLATVIVMWLQTGIALWWLRRDSFYDRFELRAPGHRGLHGPSQRALLKLGIPMGLSIGVEVTGFVFMALFIARLGDTAVAGHQIAANLVSLLFMVPLGLASATSTLVAQRIGANDLSDARRLGWHGLQITGGVALVMGAAMFFARSAVVGIYTGDLAVVAATLPLLAWVALFHVADALQTLAAFVLRAWRIATWPMVVYVVSLWGVGLGGGQWLAFGSGPWRGAQGFWIASTGGLTLAAILLTGLMAWVMAKNAAQARASDNPGAVKPPAG
jgi:MATE family multidrug resistance protein